MKPLVTMGERFGRLTVIGTAPPKPPKNQARWLCLCDCGAERVVSQIALRKGSTKSCGCLAKETTAARNRRHGATATPEYAVWCTMKARALNPNNHKYPRYGGRGIKVCDRWLKFSNFIADMGPRPSTDHTLERVDNDGDYCPENCKWIPRAQQARNRRDTRHLTIDGVTRPFAEWCELYDVSQDTAEARIYRYGWDALEALTTPLCRSKYHHQQMKVAA